MSDNNSGRLREMLHAAVAMSRAAAQAAAGNIVGAAAEVARAVPSILKTVGYILLFFLIMILLVMSLPSMLLGYSDSKIAAVQEMNSIAADIDAQLRRFDSYVQEQVADIVAGLTEGADYDDIVVDSSVNALNYYWLAAIYSVAHQQDITTMSVDDLIAKARKSLSYSTDTEVYESIDGEGNPIECTRLIITITQYDAEQYMEALGFSEEEKLWANLIYTATAEIQLLDVGSPDYQGSAGTNYGDLRFTDGGRPVVYYNQADSRWADKPYGKTISIGRGGCGPTALAMAVSSMTDTSIDPVGMSAWAYENGYCAEQYGSYHSLIPQGARAFGLEVEGATAKEGQKIIDALASGDKLVIAIMAPGHFTKTGHFILLRGVTADGSILVADPISVSRSNQAWDLKIILSEASRKAAAGGPFWVISTPKGGESNEGHPVASLP